MKRAMPPTVAGALFLVMIGASIGPAWASAESAIGFWRTPNGSALVEIARCGPSICGTFIELAREADGKTVVTDKRNQNEALRARRIKGLMFLSGYSPKGDRWEGGTLYSPELGKSYRSRVTPLNDGSLKVEGCVLQLCQAQVWSRAQPPQVPETR